MSTNLEKQNINENVTVTPKINNFFWIYLISAIPKILTSVLWFFIVFIILISIIGITSASGKTTSAISYTKINDNNSRNNVLIYNLNGAIFSGKKDKINSETGIYLDDIKKDFSEIKKDESIKNIVFKFNSPGGEVFASEELGDEINGLLRSKNINEGVFYFDSIAASGALWATYKVENNYIFASKYGETGSIGVRLEIPNISKLADNIGYKQIVIKSGASKDIGSPFRDPTNDEYAYFQGQIDQTYARFIDITANGRKLPKEKILPIANGFTYFNDKAKDLGLVNELSINVDGAVKRAGKNIEGYNVIEIEKPKTLLESIGVKFGFNNNFYLGDTNLTNKFNNNLSTGIMYSIDERFVTNASSK